MSTYDPGREFDPLMKRQVTTITGPRAEAIIGALNAQKVLTWEIKFKAGRPTVEVWSE